VRLVEVLIPIDGSGPVKHEEEAAWLSGPLFHCLQFHSVQEAPRPLHTTAVQEYSDSPGSRSMAGYYLILCNTHDSTSQCYCPRQVTAARIQIMKNNPQKFVVKLGMTRDPTRPADGLDPCPTLNRTRLKIANDFSALIASATRPVVALRAETALMAAKLSQHIATELLFLFTRVFQPCAVYQSVNVSLEDKLTKVCRPRGRINSSPIVDACTCRAAKV